MSVDFTWLVSFSYTLIDVKFEFWVGTILLIETTFTLDIRITSLYVEIRFVLTLLLPLYLTFWVSEYRDKWTETNGNGVT